MRPCRLDGAVCEARSRGHAGSLARIQDACAGVVARYDGYVAKFMGDGVLAYFGWPRGHENDAERAISSGLGVIETVGGIAPADGETESLAVRIGVATGPVVVGDIVGEGAAQEAAVTGETPNLAARLQEIAKPNTIAIATTTHVLAGGLFAYEALGGQSLKGIDGSTEVWRVVGERQVESRFVAKHTTALTPLIGRGEELDLLSRRWERAKGGNGQVVLLSGEPGIGKSRLTQALRDWIGDEPHTRLLYQCSPHHTNSALFPIISQIEHAAEFEAGETADEKLNKLEALLALAGEPLAEVVPLIASLLSIPGGERYPLPDLTPQQQKDRTLAALNAQLANLAVQQPVLFVLEDAHWIDPTSLELLELTVAMVEKLPVLAVFTYRPEFVPPWTGAPHVTLQALNRLTERDCTTMAEGLSSGAGLPAEILAQLVEKTDGVPLFVEELTRSVLDAQAGINAGDGAATEGLGVEIVIPATLQDALEARLDHSPVVREVAQVGAAIGREFQYDLLERVVSLSTAELGGALDHLSGSGLIFVRGTPPDASYTFKHALVQDTAYDSMVRSKRHDTHERITNSLIELRSDIEQTTPELLAHHYAEAGLTEPAIDYWQKAGEHALRRSANLEAINHLNKGLELLKFLPETRKRDEQELRLQLALGPALMAARGQGTSEMRQAYARARVLGQQLGDTLGHFRALYGLWRSHHVLSEHDTAQEFGEQCLNVADTSDDVAIGVVARFALGGTLIFKGDFAGARVHLERAISLYDIEKHRSLGFDYGQDPGQSSLCYLSWLQWYSGFPELSVKTGETALDLAKASNHPFTVALVHMYLAITYLCCRDWPSVLSETTAAIGLADAQGLPQVQTIASTMHGRALAEAGDFEHGIPQIEQGIAQRKAIDVRVVQLFELALLAEVYGKADRIDDGLRVVAEALDYAHRTGEAFHLPELHRLKGELLLRQDAAAAERCFRNAMETSRRQGALALTLRAATRLAHLWQSQGKTTEARDLLAPVYGWFTEGFDTADLKEAKALLDKLEPR
ncbi:MAG: AAA family ATPase [Hyphomicrobium sp.]